MNTQKGDKRLFVTIILVIGLLVGSNVVLTWFMLKANKVLEAPNEIVLTVPPELREKMVAAIQKDTQKSLSEMKILCKAV